MFRIRFDRGFRKSLSFVLGTWVGIDIRFLSFEEFLLVNKRRVCFYSWFFLFDFFLIKEFLKLVMCLKNYVYRLVEAFLLLNEVKYS